MLKPVCDICKKDIIPSEEEMYDKKIPVKKDYDIILTARVLLPPFKDDNPKSITYGNMLRRKGDI